jgi:hypothetical protein
MLHAAASSAQPAAQKLPSNKVLLLLLHVECAAVGSCMQGLYSDSGLSL